MSLLVHKSVYCQNISWTTQQILLKHSETNYWVRIYNWISLGVKLLQANWHPSTHKWLQHHWSLVWYFVVAESFTTVLQCWIFYHLIKASITLPFPNIKLAWFKSLTWKATGDTRSFKEYWDLYSDHTDELTTGLSETKNKMDFCHSKTTIISNIL